ncbi:GNAT family N-acetyltransferase [Roseivirga pacifica]|uniref:GNAT family N-acetyltransferase n=1 Tax=Roseivirga pacifica TaxID=1267423 RepID=UPI00227C0C1E|nr:GNAT family N-acetyltransferase [Roseivirga pacifica]
MQYVSWDKEYSCLKDNQFFESNEYQLLPIRYQDRYDIMKWRNEQMYHLRQSEPLTKEKQDWYFDNVVAQLFDQERPDQVLFSFLEKGVCIGYGGLVHINWLDQNAEVSFLMNTELKQGISEDIWTSFLELIEKVGFEVLSLHKIYTYAYDLRPKLYPILEDSGFEEEARLKNHILFEENYKDVVIHSKIKP